MEPVVTIPQMLKLLAASTYSAYSINLKNFGQGNSDRNKWFHSYEPGQLIMEVSTIGITARDEYRFGYYLGDGLMYSHTDEEWEQIKHEYEGEARPIQKVKRIKLLTTGQEYPWWNAMFIRVPEEVWNPLTRNN